LWRNFVLSPAALDAGRYHTLLGAAFSHQHPMHLAGNMLTLWVFCGGLPAALGVRSFIAMYLAGGILSSSAWVTQQRIAVLRERSMARKAELYHTMCFGASGAVNASVLCACVLAPFRRIWLLVVPVPAFALALAFLSQDAYGLVAGAPDDSIAHSGHLGGALCGAVWAGMHLLLRA
jgi:membrane associated rhomboid family serine protease